MTGASSPVALALALLVLAAAPAGATERRLRQPAAALAAETNTDVDADTDSDDEVTNVVKKLPLKEDLNPSAAAPGAAPAASPVASPAVAVPGVSTDFAGLRSSLTPYELKRLDDSAAIWAPKIAQAKTEVALALKQVTENQVNQSKLETKIRDIENEEALNKGSQSHVASMLSVGPVGIQAHVQQVANETQAPQFANMLGDMWSDMRLYTVPFYLEKLYGKMKKLETREGILRTNLAAKILNQQELERQAAAEQYAIMKDIAQKRAAEQSAAQARKDTEAAARQRAAAEREMASRKKAEVVTTVAPAASGEYVPAFSSETMPEVSVAVWCIMELASQYFIIYTLLAFFRSLQRFARDGDQKLKLGKFLPVVEAATKTVTYAPMLCVLFLGMRMRILQMTQGNPEKYNLPHTSVKHAMYFCVFAVFGQVIMVALIPVFTGEMSVPINDNGEIIVEEIKVGTKGLTLKPMWAKVLNGIRYFLMLGLLFCVGLIIVKIFTMPVPPELWGPDGLPVSPAVNCTLILTTTFFAVYLGGAITRTVQQLANTPHPVVKKLEGVLSLACMTVNLAPMVCILFIGARMRALQIDPKNGNPQWWAQWSFFGCTGALVIQVLIITILPMCIDCVVEKKNEGEVQIVFPSRPKLNYIGIVIRYLALTVFYGGVTAVIVSIFTIAHPQDPALTPKIPPAAVCTIILACLYLLSYTALFVANTVLELRTDRGVNKPPGVLQKLIFVFEAATKTMMFAPMLAILFYAARLRAIQLTIAEDGRVPPTAGPQPWAQDGMYLATWALLIQFLVTITLPWVLVSNKNEVLSTPDGMYQPPSGIPKWVSIILEVIQWLSIIALYGGAIIVMVAIHTMTPEKLPPYAAHKPIVPGVEVPMPPVPPTPQ